MRPFSIEYFNSHPDCKVITTLGESVRIICTDRNSSFYPVVGLVGSASEPFIYTSDGRCTKGCDLCIDDSIEFWVNVYKYSDESAVNILPAVYPSEEAAKVAADEATAPYIHCESYSPFEIRQMKLSWI